MKVSYRQLIFLSNTAPFEPTTTPPRQRRRDAAHGRQLRDRTAVRSRDTTSAAGVDIRGDVTGVVATAPGDLLGELRGRWPSGDGPVKSIVVLYIDVRVRFCGGAVGMEMVKGTAVETFHC